MSRSSWVGGKNELRVKSVNEYHSSANEIRHLLCSSVVFLHTVDVVTEVDGHDAAGVVSVHVQLRMVKGTTFNTHFMNTMRAQCTCLGLSLCVKSRAWLVRFLACRTK